MSLWKIYLILLGGMSLVTLVFFAADKKLAGRPGARRVPEMTLLSLCTFGGAAGALIGIYGLRHKTQFRTKFHFALTAILSAGVQAALLGLLLWKGGAV